MLRETLAAAALALTMPAGAQDAGTGSTTGAFEGTRWQWVSFTGPDGKRLVPQHPERYWIELQPEGRLALLADCNRGTGKWEAKGAELMLLPFASTLMACPPGSLDSRFTQLIRQAKSFDVQGRTLVVTLGESAGVLRFARIDRRAAAKLDGGTPSAPRP
jgi:heat shock protein HslJ